MISIILSALIFSASCASVYRRGFQAGMTASNTDAETWRRRSNEWADRAFAKRDELFALKRELATIRAAQSDAPSSTGGAADHA